MPKFNSDATVAVQTANKSFYTVQPGKYVAVIRKIEDKEPFMVTLSGYDNPKADDGKWPMYKITPSFELVNDEGTKIERQDLTIGIIMGGVPVSPNEKNSAVYSGWFNNGKSTRGGSLGAGGLLEAVGVMRVKDGQASFVGDTNDVKDVVVGIRTAVGAYSKTGVNYGPDEFLKLLIEWNEGTVPVFDDYHKLVNAYNEEAGYKGTEAELKMKNFVVDVYALNDSQVAEGGYYRDPATQVVYLTKASAPSAAGSTAKKAKPTF